MSVFGTANGQASVNGSVVVLTGSARIALVGRAGQLELDAMSTWQDGKFHRGETWIINGVARDQNGALLDLTGATVALRIGNENPNSLTLDLATPTNGSINSPATAGGYTFLITPTQQASMTLTSYEYEVRVTLANGNKSVQNKGVIEIEPSLFVNFP